MAFLLGARCIHSRNLYWSIDRPKIKTRQILLRNFTSSGAQVAHGQSSADMGKKRKFASVERVAEADAFYCPACTQKALKWPVFSRHLKRCCPDLLSGKAILASVDLEQPLMRIADIKKALQSATEEEEALRQQLVRFCSSIHAHVPAP